MKDALKRSWKPFLLLFVCAFVTSLNASDNPFYIGVKLRDSSVFAFMGRLILRGGMPYLDSFDHKGPLIYLINAFGLLIHDKIGIWLVEFVTVFLFLFLSYRFARMLGCSRRGSSLVVFLAILSMTYYFNWGNVTEEYAMVPILLSLLIFAKYFRSGRVTAWELLLCGLSFAAVCLLRVNMAVLWAVMCVGVLVRCLRQGRARELPRFILLFLAGAAALAVPVLLWLIRGGAAEAFIRDYFTFNMRYIGSTLLNKLNAFAVFASQPTAVLTVVPLLFFFIRDRKPLDGLCLLAALLSLWSISLAGRNYQHYGLILVPLFVCAAARTEKELSSFLRKRDPRFRRTASLCLTVAALLLFAGSFVSFGIVALPTPKKTLALAADREIAEIIRENTAPEDRISVVGSNDRIYLFADREPASVYSYQYPLADVDESIRAEYLEDLNALKARVIVMDRGEETEIFLEDELRDLLRAEYTRLRNVGAAEIWLKK